MDRIEETPKPEFGDAGEWLWVDIETTGLDPRHGEIIEFAALLSTPLPHCEHIASFSQVLSFGSYKGGVFAAHHENGLADLAEQSQMTWRDLTFAFWGWMQGIGRTDEGWTLSPMCGATPSFDKEWMVSRGNMTGRAFVESWWTHRLFDVSTLREFASNVIGTVEVEEALAADPLAGTESNHRALRDVQRSVCQARVISALLGFDKVPEA